MPGVIRQRKVTVIATPNLSLMDFHGFEPQALPIM